VTSAGLTWNRPAAPEAADYDREPPELEAQIPQDWHLVADLKEDPNDPSTSKQRRAGRKSRGRARKASPLASGFLALVRVPEKDTPAVGGINNG
jgi:hypothetical protein